MRSVFWIAIALLTYAYVIYPICMVALFGRRSRDADPVRAPHGEKDGPVDSPRTVAVIVAAYNEEGCIGERIENLLHQDYPPEQLSVLVGSDGSRDGTVAVASQFADPRVRVIDFVENRGKASVLNDLVVQAQADVLVFTDANTVFSADTIAQLVAGLDDHTHAVCGELILQAARSGSNADHQYWNIERRLKLAESSVGGLLGANGGVYALYRHRYIPIPADTICDDFVIAMRVAAAGWGLRYQPSAVAFEEAPGDMLAEYCRRVRIGIGNYQALFRYPQFLLGGSMALSLCYLSHKVLRWFTPHLLILILFASFVERGHPVFATLFALQIAGYVSLATLFMLRNRIRMPGLLKGGVLFGLLNYAFLVGFFRYLTGSYRGSWKRTER